MSTSAFEIKFADETADEIAEIFEWYNSQSQQSANNFIESLDTLFDFLSHNPYSFSKQRKNFRIAYIKKFPYAIIYEITGKVVLISKVIHTARNPRRRFRKAKKK